MIMQKNVHQLFVDLLLYVQVSKHKTLHCCCEESLTTADKVLLLLLFTVNNFSDIQRIWFRKRSRELTKVMAFRIIRQRKEARRNAKLEEIFDVSEGCDALTSHAMQDMKDTQRTWVLFRRKLYLTDASSKESPRDTHLELWKGF